MEEENMMGKEEETMGKEEVDDFAAAAVGDGGRWRPAMHADARVFGGTHHRLLRARLVVRGVNAPRTRYLASTWQEAARAMGVPASFEEADSNPSHGRPRLARGGAGHARWARLV